MNVRTKLVGICGSVTSWAGAYTGDHFAAISTHQEQIEWWLRSGSYAAAIAVSCLTGYFLIKRKGQK